VQNNLPQEIIKIILQNTHDGIMITNAKNQIVSVNQAFIDVTGYSEKDVIGKNPKLLNSDKQTASFYSTMWQELKDNEYWQGEIWNKRKNGDVFLENLSISTLKNSKDEITHYIGIFTDIQEQFELDIKAKRANSTDILTDLPNREKMIHHLNHRLNNSKRELKLLAVAILDLDDFKKINDHHGHALGDRLLVVIARRLKRLVRRSDIVGRFGGDEFALILPDLKSMDEVEQMTNRIISLVASHIEIDGHKHHISASMGLTLFPFDSSNAEILLRHADQAMYKAKENGKNQCHLFDIQKDKQAQTRRELFQQLDQAVQKNQLILYYQPKVNMRTGKVIGAEALLRWQHPENGLLEPGKFLPHVEYHDLIIDIGHWVLNEAMSQLSIWLKMGLELTVSVNIAARQLLKRDFVDSFRSITMKYPDVPLKYLELEILESAALENTEHVEEVIEECRELGINFALDDFGTGYASLSYLRDIPADILKIDQSFVFNLLNNRKDMTLVEGIIGLATAFQRTVIAEGIETSEQGVLLMRLGCDLGQGFGIAKPMPAQDIPDWVANYQPDKEWGIWADTHWEMGDFPLLVAQYDHIDWVRRVLFYLEGKKANSSKSVISDHHQCRFGHWYYDYGREKYSNIKEFNDIEPIHISVHEVGQQIVNLCDNGQMTAAQKKAKELLQLKDQVLDKLAKLQLSVAKKN